MKKLFLLAIISLFFGMAFSQNHQVVEKQYFLDHPISSLIVDGIFSVEYQSGAKTSITTISNSESTSEIIVETISKEGDPLFIKISSPGGKDAKRGKVIIENDNLKYLELSGLTTFNASGLNNTDKLAIKMQGSTDIDLNGSFNELLINTSGVANAQIVGTANTVKVEAKGASNVDISNLKYSEANISGSGVANIEVREGENHFITKNGVSTISYNDSSADSDSTKSESGKKITERNIVIKSAEGEDNAVIDILGERTEIRIKEIETDSEIDAFYEIFIKKPYKKVQNVLGWRKNKFNGHWAGIEIGINGYNTADFNMDFSKENEYLDLRFPKSTSFYLNLAEYNIAFSKNQKWGMLSGLGFEWHNYRFSHDVWLSADSDALQGYYISGANVKKAKLMTCYMTVPVIFEFQTNNKSRLNSFHVGAGVVGGLRIGTHYKVKFEEKNATFVLTDPMTGAVVSDPYKAGNKKLKQHDDFYLNPVKLDATVRIGWGKINLFATYSLTKMFRENRAPELYPWSAGITLMGW